MASQRKIPVKMSLPQPCYVANSNFLEGPSDSYSASQPKELYFQPFKIQVQGFGSRHVYDDAPFCLWNYDTATFREQVNGEHYDWMFKTYQARSIVPIFSDLVIETEHPPSKLPLTIGGAPVRFIPPGLPTLPMPKVSWKPYSRLKPDLLDYRLRTYSFPTHEQCIQIMQLLSQKYEVDFRAIHFSPPMIIVELDVSTGRKYERHSLPARTGGLATVYHESVAGYFKQFSQMPYQKLITPTSITAADNANYLSRSPHQLSPGVCLSPSTKAEEGYSPTWIWEDGTSAGLCLQNGDGKRYIPVSNHRFSHSEEVFHPNPIAGGRRIGLIKERFPDLDIAMAELDPSIPFSNKSYFAAPRPSHLLYMENISAGDWFEVDGFSSGRVDLCARGRSYTRPDGRGDSPSVAYSEWLVDIVFAIYGPTGSPVREGMCGAPVVDRKGRVAGFLRNLDPVGMWACTSALDGLIDGGWSLVRGEDDG